MALIHKVKFTKLTVCGPGITRHVAKCPVCQRQWIVDWYMYQGSDGDQLVDYELVPSCKHLFDVTEQYAVYVRYPRLANWLARQHGAWFSSRLRRRWLQARRCTDQWPDTPMPLHGFIMPPWWRKVQQRLGRNRARKG